MRAFSRQFQNLAVFYTHDGTTAINDGMARALATMYVTTKLLTARCVKLDKKLEKIRHS
jgi:hypothetical protein